MKVIFRNALNLYIYVFLFGHYIVTKVHLSQVSPRIGRVMVSVLVSIVVDRGFEPRSGQTKDYQIGICCFSTRHAALRRKGKYWLALNQDNVSE